MANADIKLDGVTAIVEGDYLLVKCSDLKLDSPSRRSQTTGHRRALVHGFNDELVVNYAKDYPGGVTIRGEVRIPEKIKQNHLYLEGTDFHLDHPDRRSTTGGYRRALVHGFNDALVLNYGKDYPGGVTIRGEVHIPEKIKQNHLILEGTDFHLDHPDRRSTTGGSRRALVHGFNDALVLNFNKDYPGGTVVHGNLELQKGGKLDFKNTAGTVKVRIDTDDFTQPAWPAWPGGSVPTRLDLIEEMRSMKEEILTLREEVDELKASG
jgi:hypothetical protein